MSQDAFAKLQKGVPKKMLNNSLILIFSFVAVFFVFIARINIYKTFSVALFVISYLCIAFCITYAFLLGVDIEEVLTYILAYTVLFATVFWNKGGENENLLAKAGAEK